METPTLNKTYTYFTKCPTVKLEEVMSLIVEKGLVIQRHNEIRDALGDLASIAYK